MPSHRVDRLQAKQKMSNQPQEKPGQAEMVHVLWQLIWVNNNKHNKQTNISVPFLIDNKRFWKKLLPVD